MNAARDLAARMSPKFDDYQRKAFDATKVGTCDGCAETAGLVAAWPTYDGSSEPWLCGPCDQEARDEEAVVNALPAIADLLDAIDAAIEGADAWGTCGHEWADLKKFAAARDAVAAALTGETP